MHLKTFLIYQGDDTFYNIKKVDSKKHAYIEANNKGLSGDEFLILHGQILHGSSAYREQVRNDFEDLGSNIVETKISFQEIPLERT